MDSAEEEVKVVHHIEVLEARVTGKVIALKLKLPAKMCPG